MECGRLGYAGREQPRDLGPGVQGHEGPSSATMEGGRRPWRPVADGTSDQMDTPYKANKPYRNIISGQEIREEIGGGLPLGTKKSLDDAPDGPGFSLTINFESGSLAAHTE